MMPRRKGWRNEGCRGCHEKWLFTNHDTGISVFKCVEFVGGEKCVWLEARRSLGGKGDAIASADASEGYVIFDIANGKVRVK